MEGEDHEMNMAAGGGGGGGSTAAAATSRWNPTKEQITLLENLYRQGIRTPTAEQIEEITGRLQAYGHIEGKNVFYWFQNHKARQRQKQKQENNFANYFHRYLHHHHQPLPVPPLFPPPQYPPCPNVVCNPYYMPQPDLGFYPPHQYPKVLVPPSTAMKKRLPRPDQLLDHPIPRPTNGYTEGSPYNIFRSVSSGCKRNIEEDQVVNNRKNQSLDHHHYETLELFPIHPTGILQARSSTTDTNICMENVEEEKEDSGTHDHLYFDFLSGN